ncbi:DNA (cytosine-5)-methyltransferase 1A, partial [Leucoagaricus sp. SymC.cos]
EYGLQEGDYYATGRTMPVEAVDSDDEDDEGDDDYEDFEAESDVDDEDDMSDGSQDDDEMPSTYIRTSRILNITFYDYPESKRMDRNIYIQTASAWYILGRPSTIYQRHFTPFWIRVYILHLAVAAAKRYERLTYDEFLRKLKKMSFPNNNPVTTPKMMLGRQIVPEDLEDDEVRAFLAATTASLCDDCNLKLKRTPLLRYLINMPPLPPAAPKSAASSAPSSSSARKRPEPEQAKATVITPMVGQIAEQLFNNPFRVIGEPQEAEEVAETIANVKEHNEDPTSIVWGEPAKDSRDHFESVLIDGEMYSVGDVVMVIPGEDQNRKRAENDKTAAAQSPNQYGNQLWFCLIFYFMEKKEQKLFHGQWLVHGSKTILQEAAHSKSLFLINSCHTNPVASIFKKCQIKWLEHPDAKEPSDNRDPRSEDYHCGRPIRNGFSLYNVTYHRHDCVYIRPPDSSDFLLEIAQIIDTVKTPAGDIQDVQVRFLARYDDYRRLYLTSRVGRIDPERLDGICYVRHLRDHGKIDEWIQYNDHFYLNQKGDMHGLFHIDEDELDVCGECMTTRLDELARNKQLLKQRGPLRGLELFSGAGGLGTGVDMSGYVKTKWAVEYFAAAAKTYKRRNHPETKVYCQDSSLLLKHAIETHQGRHIPRLLSNDGVNKCPLMPKQDEVDFIFGGPPCQSFSGANHNKQADDIRSTMPCNMLSYLEHYNASYLLLENVRGLLNHPLLSEQIGRVLSGGIKSGVVKFIMRTLIALGYQVQWKVLQAGQYGAPQNRERVIFWAAKRGLPLPKHPVPVYAWKKGAISPLLVTGDKLAPPTRSLVKDASHQCAPLRPITVQDAIGDLVRFMINPHSIIKTTPEAQKLAQHRRKELGIPRVDAVCYDRGSNEFDQYPGYPDGVTYGRNPQNRFQMWLRRDMKQGEQVQGHYTKRFSEKLVEATTTVPLVPGADHIDLPQALRPKTRKEGGPRKSPFDRFAHIRVFRTAFYGRLDPNGHFTCVMTNLTPVTKNARPLHPDQMRMVTMRECARTQGFPDHYIFESTKTGAKIYEEQMKQIGNAVPVPMALALGKELGAALTQAWREEIEREQQEERERLEEESQQQEESDGEELVNCKDSRGRSLEL